MTFLKSAPVLALSAILAATTSLYSLAEAGCSSCGNNSVEQTAPRKIIKRSSSPRRITRREIFPSRAKTNESIGNEMRNSAYGPIFGSDDCSRNEGPMFGDNTCTRRKCGGAMFGPQTCKKIELPCEDCKKEAKDLDPNAPAIRNIKEIPAIIPDPVYKCSDLAPVQLEWVDFRLQRGRTQSYSRDLGNYRFRLFGCRRNSKKAMLNEGRIIQKNMKFIEIFEDTVRDCYSIVKLPTDICLQSSPYKAPEYILTAEISDYFMNVCDGYNWDEAQNENLRTGSAEMTVVWRLMDLSKSKILWKGETTGYSELQNGTENGEMQLIEDAFAEAVRNLKGMPEFEAQLAVRVSPKEIERQKNVLLAQERAEDPIKCKFEPQQVTTTACAVNPEALADSGGIQSNGGALGDGYTQTSQCKVPAEMLEFEAPETKAFQCTGAGGSQSLYTSQGTALCPVSEKDVIPLELQTANIVPPYTSNNGTICYGYNNASNVYEFNPYTISGEKQQIPEKISRKICEPEIVDYFKMTENNTCENPLFAENNEACDPSLTVFLKAEGTCSSSTSDIFEVQETDETNVPQTQMCLFAENNVTSTGGISKDDGYFIPEVETIEITANENIQAPSSWQPYEDTVFTISTSETADDIPVLEGVPMESVSVIKEVPTTAITVTEETSVENILQSGGFRENGFIYIRNEDDSIERVKVLEITSGGNVSQSGGIRDSEFVYIQHEDGKIEQVKLTEEIKTVQDTNISTNNNFCIENEAPYKDLNPENMYKVRASVMSVDNHNGKRAAGLLISKDLILVSADIIDENIPEYEIETINGVKAQARVHRINLQKNLALLQSTTDLYFRPLSLNMELPATGKEGYISLGWLNNAEGENYLDDAGTIQGYRYSEDKGTEIIVDTFVQTVSSGSTLIDDKGTVNGFASTIKKYDNSSDLYVPILDAINSVGLEVCGQTESLAPIPTAVVKPMSSAIESDTSSKAPEILAKKNRK